MSRPDDPLDAPPEVVAIAKYNDLVTRNLRNSQVLEGLVESAGARLTRATFEVLASVDRRGPLRLSHLVARMGVDQSTISRQIRPLEELGLIERTEDPADRRAVWLATTPAGHDIIARVRHRVNRNVEAALASWSQQDREQLGLLLDRFRTSVIELTRSAGFDPAGSEAAGAHAEPLAGSNRGTDASDASAASDGTSVAGTAGRSRRAARPVPNGSRARVRGRKDVGNSATGEAAGAGTSDEPSKTKPVRAAGAGGRTGHGARPPRGGGPRRVRGTGGAS